MSRDLPPPRAATSVASMRQILDDNVSSVALSDIEIVPHFNPRSAISTEQPFTRAALNDLIESINENGVLQPLLLRPIGNDRYALVAGERRYHASRFAGLKAVPAYIREMTEREAEEFALHENLQRSDLSADAKALLAIRAVARHMDIPEDQTVLVAGRIKKSSEDPKGLGDMLRRSFGISVSTFAQRYGKFTRFNQDEKRVIVDGRYGISTLSPLTQLPEGTQRTALLQQLLDGHITGAQLERQVSALRRGKALSTTPEDDLKTANQLLKKSTGTHRERALEMLNALLEHLRHPDPEEQN